jgi:hypothetical protein
MSGFATKRTLKPTKPTTLSGPGWFVRARLAKRETT